MRNGPVRVHQAEAIAITSMETPAGDAHRTTLEMGPASFDAFGLEEKRVLTGLKGNQVIRNPKTGKTTCSVDLKEMPPGLAINRPVLVRLRSIDQPKDEMVFDLYPDALGKDPGQSPSVPSAKQQDRRREDR